MKVISKLKAEIKELQSNIYMLFAHEKSSLELIKNQFVRLIPCLIQAIVLFMNMKQT